MTVKKTLAAVAAVCALSVAVPAVAGHGVGPKGFNNQTSVEQVKKNGRDDQFVILDGRLTAYLGDDRYEFRDNTGAIEVELDDDRDWSFLSKDELIRIYGKLDVDFLSTKIDVKKAVSLEKGGHAAGAPLGAPKGM